mgnify:CR=1 FL=1
MIVEISKSKNQYIIEFQKIFQNIYNYKLEENQFVFIDNGVENDILNSEPEEIINWKNALSDS